jgi:hypothetical protein
MKNITIRHLPKGRLKTGGKIFIFNNCCRNFSLRFTPHLLFSALKKNAGTAHSFLTAAYRNIKPPRIFRGGLLIQSLLKNLRVLNIPLHFCIGAGHFVEHHKSITANSPLQRQAGLNIIPQGIEPALSFKKQRVPSLLQ